MKHFTVPRIEIFHGFSVIPRTEQYPIDKWMHHIEVRFTDGKSVPCTVVSKIPYQVVDMMDYRGICNYIKDRLAVHLHPESPAIWRVDIVNKW